MKLTHDRIAGIVSLCHFKDWLIEVKNTPEGRLYVQATFPAEDSKTGEERIWSGRKWMLSPWMTPTEVVRTVYKAVLAAVEHEAAENFLYHGRAIFGPHVDITALWAAAPLEDVRPAKPDTRIMIGAIV